MEILEFVKLDEVDPLYFDASYYITPEDAGLKAYQLLMKAMQESGYGAIAKLTMHQREHIVIIRPRAKGLTLHTMFYANEIRAAEYGPTDKVEAERPGKEAGRAAHRKPGERRFSRKISRRVQDNVRAMIAAKLKGQEVAAAPHPISLR